jgi:hypothetical protein
MMKPSRSKTSTFQQYQDLYLAQMHDVVESMFPLGKGKINPGDPKNWLLQQNIVWGGVLNTNTLIRTKAKRVVS